MSEIDLIAHKRSWAGRWSWAAKVGLLSLQVVPQLWLCPARQLKQQLRSALGTAQWREDTALTLPLFWQRSMVSLNFFRRYLWSSLHSLVLFPPPPPPVPVPNKQPRSCGRKATLSRLIWPTFIWHTGCRSERIWSVTAPLCSNATHRSVIQRTWSSCSASHKTGLSTWSQNCWRFCPVPEEGGVCKATGNPKQN